MAKYRLRNSGVEAIHLNEPIYVKNPKSGWGEPKFLEYGRGWVLVMLEGKNVFMTAQEFHHKYEGEQEDSVQKMPAEQQQPSAPREYPYPFIQPPMTMTFPNQPSGNWQIWSTSTDKPATPERETERLVDEA